MIFYSPSTYLIAFKKTLFFTNKEGFKNKEVPLKEIFMKKGKESNRNPFQ